MQIADGIHRIDTELGPRVNSLYLFRGRDACLLFDRGVDGHAQRATGVVEMFEVDGATRVRGGS